MGPLTASNLSSGILTPGKPKQPALLQGKYISSNEIGYTLHIYICVCIYLYIYIYAKVGAFVCMYVPAKPSGYNFCRNAFVLLFLPEFCKKAVGRKFCRSPFPKITE